MKSGQRLSIPQVLAIKSLLMLGYNAREIVDVISGGLSLKTVYNIQNGKRYPDVSLQGILTPEVIEAFACGSRVKASRRLIVAKD